MWVVSAAEVLIKIARCLFPLANWGKGQNVESGSRDSGLLRHVRGHSRSSFFIGIVVYFFCAFSCRTEGVCLMGVMFFAPRMSVAAAAADKDERSRCAECP